jgi:arsenite/tail-anchored protein-transporting ATPase
VWRLSLPAVRKDELELVRRGDELILGVGPYRRVLPLPSALRRCRVVGAALERGELRVRCEPDPALWPGGAGGADDSADSGGTTG